MKHLTFALSMALASAAFAHSERKGPPHLDLEMTSAEYAHHLKALKKNKSGMEIEDPIITSTIKLGTRLSSWIAKVNATRTPETAIRLTSATTRTGIPIDKPNTYSPSIIKEKLAEALAQTPEEMKAIILSLEELPSTIPVDDATFIKAARLIDRQYQSAARYKSIDQWRSHYAQRAKQDVRGYHYLKSNKVTAETLAEVSQIPAEKLPAITDALAQICFNHGLNTVDSCKDEVFAAQESNQLAEVYRKYIENSKAIWDHFFIIPAYAVRSDIVWNGTTATVPMNTPSIPKFIPYLQVNIEDEFRWDGWGLKMEFGDFPDGPVLIFQPGVVPHVNGLGGNQIVMDSNQPIEEYESQWTIRHEFGHVLGLPDCYHEFYDTNLKAYVNYQLDITDLMCSRAGNMNERIYKELKEAYANEI